MKKTLLVVLLSLVCSNGPAVMASTSVIYGTDNRTDTFDSSSDLFQRLATSTAAQIHKDSISQRGNGFELHGPSIGEAFKLCKKERFYHQPIIASCSGFLVAPDIIATAGHCMSDKSDCSQNFWVFDYRVEEKNQGSVTVEANDVYKCKEVIKQAYTDKLDFALVRLDRSVVNHFPVKISKTEAEVGTPLVMIGHPSGLPQKIADGAIVRSTSETQFKANLDAFQINSGSAIFHAKTGELLGILVKGNRDYRTNPQSQCSEVNVLNENSPGEDISSFTQFTPYL